MRKLRGEPRQKQVCVLVLYLTTDRKTLLRLEQSSVALTPWAMGKCPSQDVFDTTRSHLHPIQEPLSCPDCGYRIQTLRV